MKTIFAAALAAALALTPTTTAAVSDEESIYTKIYGLHQSDKLGEVTLTNVSTTLAATYGDGKTQIENGEWVDLLPITSFSEGNHSFTYQLGGDLDLITGVEVTIPQAPDHGNLITHQLRQGKLPALLSTNSDTETQELSFSVDGITHYLTHPLSSEMTGMGIVFDIQVQDVSGRTHIFHQAYSAGNGGIAANGVQDPFYSSDAPLFSDCTVKDTADLQLCGQWTGIRWQQYLTPPTILPTTGQPPVDPPVVTPPTEEPPVVTPPPVEPPVEVPPTEEPPVETPPTEVPAEDPEPSPTPVYSELAQTGAQPHYALLGVAGLMLFVGAFLVLTENHIRRSTR